MGNFSFPLNRRQAEIVMADSEQPTLVLAPPGTGKTHIVVGRILYLLEETPSLSAREILVLCFTRAAVKEITTRLTELVSDKGMHDDLRFVTVRTFDSYATHLLLEDDPERELFDAGYDERIEMINEVLENPDSIASKRVNRIRHLIVDEIQDLVGLRARLVQLMLERTGGGFTLLGDPAQAIYGFALTEEGGLDPDGLISWIRSRDWFPPLVEKNLEKNYRSTGKIADLAVSLRPDLLSGEAEDLETFDRLKGVVSSLDSIGSGRSIGDDFLSQEGDICILCRNNGEVLQLAILLALERSNNGDGSDPGTDTGLRVYIKPGAGNTALPAWIARMLSTWKEKWIPRQVFLDRWRKHIAIPGQPTPEDAWRWLKLVEGSDEPDLNIRKLHKKLRRGYRLPDDADAYLTVSASDLSLSTIHSSKGREFDRVVILEPEDRNDRPEDPLEEARVLYVAATRAKQDLVRIERGGIPFLWKEDCESGQSRWVASSRKSNNYFIEIGLQDDFDPCSPVSEYVHQSPKSAREQQEYMWNSVRAGDRVFIRSYRRGVGRYRYKFYEVLHPVGEGEEKNVLGQLSKSFKEDMKDVLAKVKGTSISAYPDYFKNITVAALVTEVMPVTRDKVHEPFLTSGFCLGVRLRGMGFLCQKN